MQKEKWLISIVFIQSLFSLKFIKTRQNQQVVFTVLNYFIQLLSNSIAFNLLVFKESFIISFWPKLELNFNDL